MRVRSHSKPPDWLDSENVLKFLLLVLKLLSRAHFILGIFLYMADINIIPNAPAQYCAVLHLLWDQ